MWVCVSPSLSGSGGDGGLVKVVPFRLCPRRAHVSFGRHLSPSVPLLVVFTPSPPVAYPLLQSPALVRGQRAKTRRRCAQTLSSHQRILGAERSLPEARLGLCKSESSTCRATGRDERSFKANSLRCDLYHSCGARFSCRVDHLVVRIFVLQATLGTQTTWVRTPVNPLSFAAREEERKRVEDGLCVPAHAHRECFHHEHCDPAQSHHPLAQKRPRSTRH